MKHSILAVAAALLLAFCTKEKTVTHGVAGKAWPYYWYTYQGDVNDYVHQFDEDWYVMDEDQWPDCINPTGYIRCSVKCMGDAWIEGKPDFTTIIGIRYRPL